LAFFYGGKFTARLDEIRLWLKTPKQFPHQTIQERDSCEAFRSPSSCFIAFIDPTCGHQLLLLLQLLHLMSAVRLASQTTGCITTVRI
jgi:hypothetical protein